MLLIAGFKPGVLWCQIQPSIPTVPQPLAHVLLCLLNGIKSEFVFGFGIYF